MYFCRRTFITAGVKVLFSSFFAYTFIFYAFCKNYSGFMLRIFVFSSPLVLFVYCDIAETQREKIAYSQARESISLKLSLSWECKEERRIRSQTWNPTSCFAAPDMWLGLWCHCSQTKQVYAPSSNLDSPGTKTGLCRTDCSTWGSKCCDNFRELGWHKIKPGDNNTVWKGWGNIIQEPFTGYINPASYYWMENWGCSNGQPTSMRPPLTKKLVFSPSCDHRIGIFCLSYIPVIFSHLALFITESTLHFSPIFFTSPNSWETSCIIVFLNS